MTNYLSGSQKDQGVANFMVDFSNKMEADLNAEVSENPHSVTNYLLLLQFYNISYYFDVNRLEKAVAIADKAIALSPGRPQVYYEIATSHYYLGGILLNQKQM